MKKQTPYGLAEILTVAKTPPYFEMEAIPLVGGMFGDVYTDGKHVYGFNGHEAYKYTEKQFKRALQLLNEYHEPKYVRIYDNGGATADRYTVVFTKKSNPCEYIGMSSQPYHPTFGVFTRGDSFFPIDRPKSSHLGKHISFAKLPLDCQEIVLREYADLWGFQN